MRRFFKLILAVSLGLGMAGSSFADINPFNDTCKTYDGIWVKGNSRIQDGNASIRVCYSSYERVEINGKQTDLFKNARVVWFKFDSNGKKYQKDRSFSYDQTTLNRFCVMVGKSPYNRALLDEDDKKTARFLSTVKWNSSKFEITEDKEYVSDVKCRR